MSDFGTAAAPSYGGVSAEASGSLSPRPQPRTVFTTPTDLTQMVDLTSDATIVAGALQQARGKSPFHGLAWLGRLKFEAWLEARMRDPILKKLEVRKDVAEAQRSAEEAQNQLKGAQHDGSRSIERNRIEMNQIRRQRLMSDLATAAGPQVINADSSSDSAGVASFHITDEQIEALALRAAMNLGPDSEEADGDDSAWIAYRAELYSKLPANIAREIERRIQEIRAVTR